MTTNDFYSEIQKAIEEEHDAGSLYVSLAKEASCEEDKKCLMKMAKQEIGHRAALEWIYMKKDV